MSPCKASSITWAFGKVARSTLGDANGAHDWRIYADMNEAAAAADASACG